MNKALTITAVVYTSKRRYGLGEEPPLTANSERFTTVLVGLRVEEYHTKECLHCELFDNFRLTLRFKLGNMPTETKLPGRKNIVMAAILKFKVGVMERNT